ncbi:MAG: ABC transporter ATP-binding protein [Bacteroidales bacterium]|jgi:ABC-type multidrug transport system ATPase subunit|nr:ABC transporter ATP-binding protein [Bacteroidales bacterium]
MIKVRNICKSFGAVRALNDVSFEVRENELFGLIGPDGAGKSTLFHILISLMKPDSGDVALWGLDSVRDYRAIRKIIGYMPGKFSLYEDLTVEENLQFFASVFGVRVEENYRLIEDVYRHIAPFGKRPAGKLSGGMKQKLALSCALIHKPRLLVLDEPTTGVDAVSRKEFWDNLKTVRQAGVTAIVATPYMDEAALCDRIAFINNGHIFSVDTPQNIVKRTTQRIFAVRAANMRTLPALCRSLPGVMAAYSFGDAVHLAMNRHDAEAGEIRQQLICLACEKVEVKTVAPIIEDCFIITVKNQK